MTSITNDYYYHQDMQPIKIWSTNDKIHSIKVVHNYVLPLSLISIIFSCFPRKFFATHLYTPSSTFRTTNNFNFDLLNDSTVCPLMGLSSLNHLNFAAGYPRFAMHSRMTSDPTVNCDSPPGIS